MLDDFIFSEYINILKMILMLILAYRANEQLTLIAEVFNLFFIMDTTHKLNLTTLEGRLL